MVTLPTATIAELLADLGFDRPFIDGEHGPREAREILGRPLQAVPFDETRASP
jgi:2-keto-3-deoxy-L-rhamnonate aldolase RhmA